MSPAAELDDTEFVRDIARRFGRGAKSASEDTNSSTSIMELVDIHVSSPSICEVVLIECDDEEEADVEDDGDKRGNPEMRLSELLPSCSGSVPKSSLRIPFAQFMTFSSLTGATRRGFRTLAFTSTAALTELVARIFRFTPMRSSVLPARNPAFSSTRSATVFTRLRNWDESLVLKMLRSGACSGLRVSGSE